MAPCRSTFHAKPSRSIRNPHICLETRHCFYQRNRRAGYGLNTGTVFSDLKPAATGGLAGVDRVDHFAAEALWLRGAWSAQAEVAQVIARRAVGDRARKYRQRAVDVVAQRRWPPLPARCGRRSCAREPGWPGTGTAGRLHRPRRWRCSWRPGAYLRLAATCYPRSHVRVIAKQLYFRRRRQGIGEGALASGLRVQFDY